MNLFTGWLAEMHGCETYGIRPEHVAMSMTDREWPGTLRHVEHLGSDTIAYVDGDGLGTVTVRAPGEIKISAGERIFLTPQKSEEHRFRNGRRI